MRAALDDLLSAKHRLESTRRQLVELPAYIATWQTDIAGHQELFKDSLANYLAGGCSLILDEDLPPVIERLKRDLQQTEASVARISGRRAERAARAKARRQTVAAAAGGAR